MLDLKEGLQDLRATNKHPATERESEAAASAVANGEPAAGENRTNPTASEQPTESTAESEPDSEWKQRWVGNAKPTRGPDFSSDSNGQSTEERDPNRVNESDREQTNDDTELA